MTKGRRLRSLLRSVASEVEPSKYMVASRRVEVFIKKMSSVEEGEVVLNEG